MSSDAKSAGPAGLSRAVSGHGCARFKGKIAIVTGGTAGIGLAIAARLASEGARVMLCSRKQKNVDDALKALKAEGLNRDGSQVVGMACHVGDSAARKQLIAETLKKFGGGRIDVLISNVACNPVMGSMTDATDEKSWDKVFELNVKAAFFLAKECVPHMPRGSAVLFVASYAAYNPSEMLGAYSVSKTALVGLTKVMSKDLAPKGIRVTCVAPGVIKTAFSEALWKGGEEAAQSEEAVAKYGIPLARYGEAHEIAGPVAFLVSDDASYITGETLLVSGGITARL